MKKIIAIIAIICILSTFSITYFYTNESKNNEINNLKNNYEKEINDIESTEKFYKNSFYNQVNETKDLKSLVDCLLKENFSINPIKGKSLLFGTWKTIDNKTTIRIDNDTFCKTIIINDTTYIVNDILISPTTMWGSDPCNLFTWRLINTSCELRIIVYHYDYSEIKETFGYTLSENNTVLIIGKESYNKTP